MGRGRLVRRIAFRLFLVLFTLTNLPVAAIADPPPWAPANGWREHHHHEGEGGDDEGDRDDRDREGHDRGDRNWDDRDRGVVVQHYQMVQRGGCDRGLLARSLSGSSNNVVGSLLGGAAGGLLGNQFGKGSGKAVTTLLGAVAGIMVGGSIGRSMDPVDQGCVGQALEHAPTNQPVAWQNPDTGAQYQVVPVRTYQTEEGSYCREYTTSAVIDGQRQRVQGTACRQPDGSWRVQN